MKSYGKLRGHPLSTYVKFSEQLTFLTPLIRTRTCAYQGVRNVNFSENFAYVLNEWPLMPNTAITRDSRQNEIKSPTSSSERKRWSANSNMGYRNKLLFTCFNIVLTFTATIFGQKISCIQLTCGKIYYAKFSGPVQS